MGIMCVMKRGALLACAATVLVIPSALALGGVSRQPLLGVSFKHGADRLVWLDPLTLRQSGSRSLGLPAFTSWDRSPDGAGLAVAGDGGRVRFVNLRRMRTIGVVTLNGFSTPGIAWLTPRTVLVYDTLYVAAVDPLSLRVRWRKTLPKAITPFSFEAKARSSKGLVFLLSPTGDSVGETTLVSIDLTGQVRSQVLTEILSGVQQDPSGASLFTGSLPGLALDPQAGRAYVISGDGLAAEVDLATLAVSYHHPPMRTLASTTKVLNGPSRRAIWLGNGLIAVTGDNGHSSIDPANTAPDSDTPAGLTIINTATWTAHTVDSTTSDIAPAGETLLAWDWTAQTSPPSAGTGSGLSAYGLDGTPPLPPARPVHSRVGQRCKRFRLRLERHLKHNRDRVDHRPCLQPCSADDHAQALGCLDDRTADHPLNHLATRLALGRAPA
jgi:hypothetical protein